MGAFASNHPKHLPHLRVSLYGDCNMRCIYCPPWGENSYALDDNMDTQPLKLVLKRLGDEGFEVVKFTGGEPTLRKDLLEIVEYAADIFGETRLITNGWNLSRIAPELKRVGLGILEISMDAAQPESYASMTQTSTAIYYAVLAGIKSAIAQGFPIQLNMVLTQKNRDQIGPMLALVESLGNVTLKILELVYYEYPGYAFWKENFVSMADVIPSIQAYSQGTSWVYPPGNVGSPMSGFALKNGAQVVVKDGVIGTTYANICEGCAVFPCQDGLYGLTLTIDGYLKMCKHRADLHLALFELQEGRKVFSERKMQESIQEIVSRYSSLYFLEKDTGGWTPDVVDLHKSVSLVQPTHKVLKWYRKKEYGNGYEEVIGKKSMLIETAVLQLEPFLREAVMRETRVLSPSHD